MTFEFVIIVVVGGEWFYLDIPPEAPAFLCEKMGVELDLKKMADMTVVHGRAKFVVNNI